VIQQTVGDQEMGVLEMGLAPPARGQGWVNVRPEQAVRSDAAKLGGDPQEYSFATSWINHPGPRGELRSLDDLQHFPDKLGDAWWGKELAQLPAPLQGAGRTPAGGRRT
jgi:hypothetical protein